MDIESEKNLLALIEERSQLYNYKDKDHANKMVIEKLWEEIATEMNFTVSECKAKWTSLRNAYGRYLKVERTRPPGSKKHNQKWYLADAMSFVKEFINQQSYPTSSLDIQDVDDSKDETSDDDPLIELTQSRKRTVRNSPVPSKKIKSSVTEIIAGPMIEFLQSKTKEKSSENANQLLFKSLLDDYAHLSNRNQRSFRSLMLSKMNELQEEQENEIIKASTATLPSNGVLNKQIALQKEQENDVMKASTVTLPANDMVKNSFEIKQEEEFLMCEDED